MSAPLASDLVRVSFDQELRVLTIRIDTGHRANIINKQVLERLSGTVCAAIEKYPGLRAVVVRGRDDAFCGGADVTDLLRQEKPSRREMLLGEHALFRQIEELPVVSVAVLTGPCLGLGAHIALACDFRIARADTRLGLPESRVGISASVQRLSRFVGIGRAKEMLLLGRELGARQALDWGLVTEVAEADEFEDRVASLVRASAGAAPLATAAIKISVEADYPWDDSRHAAEVDRALEALDTDDFSEGILAIRERRRPNFTGH
jgi:enoyl-CoA hydratase/carnithine racemase